MRSPIGRPHGLVARGDAGVTCDQQGLALAGLDLTCGERRDSGQRRHQVRPLVEIDQILEAAYGPQPHAVVLRVHRGLLRAAAWLDAGDLGRASLETVMLGFPPLTGEALTKLARIANLEKTAAAWLSEPRVPAGQAGGGQWTSDASTSAGAAKPAGLRPAARRPVKQTPPVQSPALRPDPPLGDGAYRPGAVTMSPYQVTARPGQTL